MYEGRVVCRFAPDGSLQQEMELPAQCPTMPCFGGEDLRTLYVTSARKGRPADELAVLPDSGSVFHRQVATAGLPVNFMQVGP
jgi:sugar lactone lactonase YvrE